MALKTITFLVSADSWNGDPQFTVTAGGQQIGGTLTASASHGSGQWQAVTLTTDSTVDLSDIDVAFTNDAYGGWGLDRNLYVKGMAVDGQSLSPTAVTGSGNSTANGVVSLLSNGIASFDAPVAATPVAASTTTSPAATAGTNTLVLKVAADSWTGDPQFTVKVDGQQVGGTFTASASHAAGQWQTVTVTGAFAAKPASVVVSFVNDAYGGNGMDRNLYVGALTINGTSMTPASVSGASNTNVGGVATLLSNGTATFATGSVTTTPVAAPTTPAVTTTTIPVTAATTTPVTTTTAPVAATTTAPATTTPVATHTIDLRVAADSWTGDPQFTVSVNGQQIGGTYSATASHAAGQWQDVMVTGAFAANPSSVVVTFTNDAYGGNGRDRNLYVQSLAIDGVALAAQAVTGSSNSLSGNAATLLSNGTAAYAPVAAVATPTTTTTASTTTTAGATTLVLRVAADSWNGDPQFTVTVDGQQVGGTLTTSASHAAGQWQDITLTGAFSASPSSVAVSFANDAYGGNGMDRNLYVEGVTVAGKALSASTVTGGSNTVSGATATLLSNGTATFGAAASTASTTTSVTTTPGTTTSTGVITATTGGLSLLGVNLAGAEFGPNTPSATYGTDYTYPTHQEIDYYASKGMNVIRVPFLWERMEKTLDGPIDPAELARLKDVVDYATSKGLKTILDVHDYGSYYGNLIGSAAVPTSSYADFWGKLAVTFSSNPDVIYGLMNEPNQQTGAQWLGDANAAIAAIRADGAKQEILVPGSSWDGAWTWTSSDNATTVGTGVKDPDNNYAFEVHQYLDPNGSGTQAGVSSDTLGVDRLTAITSWAESHGAKLFLGEFGVSQDSQSLSALDKMLTFMGQHNDVWQGGTYWAGGPWWYGSNIYGVEPNGLGTANVKDQPQMAILSQHVSH